MTAVAAKDEIVGSEVVSHTYSGCLLTHGKVGGTGVVILNTIVTAGGLYQIQHCLELTDGEHITVDVLEIILCEVLLFEFFLDSLVILIDRNRGNLYF